MIPISVMIVDDERLAVDDLINIVDWQAAGFEIVATAVNGKQALSKFRELRPQVMVTDIRMPYMDGIELIEHVREIDKDVKILLLTAYKDFSYAKSAIRHGITDYIVKSDINETTILETLSKVRAMIESEDSTLETVRRKELEDFFSASASVGEDKAQQLFRTPYCYLIVEQDMPVNISGDSTEEQHIYLNAADIPNTPREDEKRMKVVTKSGLRRGQALVTIHMKESSRSIVNSKLLAYAKQIQEFLRAEYTCSLTVYILSMKMDLEELRRLYYANQQWFRMKHLLGVGKIYDLPLHETAQDLEDVSVDEGLMDEWVEQGDGGRVQSYIDQLFSQVCESRSYMALYYTSRSLYDILRRHIRALPGADGIDISAANNAVRWCDAADIKKWVGEKFAALMAQGKKVNYSKPVLRAIEVVRKNYCNSDLTVGEIADKVYLSVGHLCALFKKETGKTIKDFITEVRIAESKRLLTHSDKKIYEISTSVGYRSSQYFSQVFFRQTGTYPSDYQRGKSAVSK